MKTKNLFKLIAVPGMVAVFVTGLLFPLSNCKKETTTVHDTVTKTVTNTVTNTIILNPSLSDATNNGTDKLNVLAGQFTTNTPADSGKWKMDKAHSNVMWETQYIASGALLTGRFNNFNVAVNFDEATPANTVVKAWVQLSTYNTGEPGRDAFGDGSNPVWNAAAVLDNIRMDTINFTPGKITTDPLIPQSKFRHIGCGMTYMGVKFDTAKTSTGKYALPGPKLTPKATTDTAFFVSTGCVKTDNYYTVSGNFTFRGVTKPVSMKMGFYKRFTVPTAGTPIKTDKAGLYGEFIINANTDFGVNSTSINDKVKIRVNCNMTTNKYTKTNPY